ncbi:MAG: methyltransferase domain-containing protein [Promethearchaeota archaeon]|jgi:ubiquinone/menaquinone biosynthesis C-methylase UbiE
MTEEILKELNVDGLRSVFLKYTKEAFESIPEMDNPRILDIGCGTGIPTLEIAKLSNGEITGIDIDQGVLDQLNLTIKQQGLSDRINVYNRSIYDTQFEDETFDLILEEGTLHILDLKRALTECNRVLKLNGFMVTGETTNWTKRKLKHFPRFGFKFINEIPWENGSWWKEYYSPLEERIINLRKKYEHIDKIEEIQHHLTEIEMVKKDPTSFDCSTIIFQKINYKKR